MQLKSTGFPKTLSNYNGIYHMMFATAGAERADYHPGYRKGGQRVRYHMRRHDKEDQETGLMDEVLTSRRYVTVAMCRGGEPYLVALTHGYDPEQRCLYFHCADAGKKIDFLKANPCVWGQCLDDRGYLDGQCDHAFVCVHFGGKVRFVEDREEKLRAVELLVRRHESDPAGVTQRNLKPERIDGVTICRIDIEEMTCKKSLPPGGENQPAGCC